MKRILLINLLGIIFISTSCSPEFDIDLPDTSIPEEITMENLVVSSNFDWKTYTNVDLTLTGNSNNIVEVASEDGLVYQKAYLSKDNAYTMKLTVPTHETSVKLLYNEQDVTIDISSGQAEYIFE